jgi:branched-chain amino acid aminotransferase
MSTTIPAESPTLSVELTASPVDADTRARLLENPGFGALYGEHMVRIDYVAGEGWGRSLLQPYAPIQLEPATAVFHYAQAMFEGLKAYRLADGGVGTFRPEANAARMNRSGQRLAMPALPPERFIEAIDALVTADAEWVPGGDGQSLYLRPLMFATEPMLQVRPSKTFTFFVIDSPSGAYFKGGVKPVTVWVSEDYTRAAPGGTGYAKVGGNYAASLAAQLEAEQAGCDGVIWLDAVERQVIEEMGGMNLFFVFGEGDDITLVTPELTGTLLPGVTRDSILQLGRDFGFRVEERRITMDEWRSGNADGSISEAFACGTAAVITPVGHVKSRTDDFSIRGGAFGPVASRLRETLLGIQHGTAPDPHGWLHRVV